jgi:putative phosphoesterase
MKIIIFTDVHANLPALQAMLSTAKAEGYDLLVHLGDAIAIGPYPVETLDLLLSTPNIRFVKGNHDQWFAEGLPNPIPEWMSEAEVDHQHWTHSQIDPQLRTVLADWPMLIQDNIDGLDVAFMHYPLYETKKGFAKVWRDPTEEQLEILFQPFTEPVIFYGHTHAFSDKKARARYVNPGSLGCFSEPIAHFTVLKIANGYYHIEHRMIEYNDDDLWKAFEERKVPEREFLYNAFFGGRFAGAQE